MENLKISETEVMNKTIMKDQEAKEITEMIEAIMRNQNLQSKNNFREDNKIKNENVMSAILILLGDLDRLGLQIIKNEVEDKIKKL